MMLEGKGAAITGKEQNKFEAFMPVLTDVLADIATDLKRLNKIADGLSVMDKMPTSFDGY